MKMPSRNRARSIEELREFGIEAPAQTSGLAPGRATAPAGSARAHAGGRARWQPHREGTQGPWRLSWRLWRAGWRREGLPEFGPERENVLAAIDWSRQLLQKLFNLSESILIGNYAQTRRLQPEEKGKEE